MRVKGIARYAHLVKEYIGKNPDTGHEYPAIYGVNVLIHKSDPQCAKIIKGCKEALMNDKILNKYTLEDVTCCFVDMALDSKSPDSLNDYMCLKAKVKVGSKSGRPPAVDHKFDPIIDPGFQVDGQIINIECNFKGWYIDEDKKYITCYLNGTLVTKEKGNLPLESLSAKPSIEQMFAGIDVNNEEETPDF